MKLLLLSTCLLISTTYSFSQTDTTSTGPEKEEKSKKWYEAVHIRGYAQVRYNGLFQTNPDLACEQCDRSWGGDPSFFIRRTRVIFFGKVSPRVYFYIQPDFANSPNATSLNYVQLRDAYFDLSIDDDNEFRFRVGQSKVPYGFENMQSSQNRLTLDRGDGINSALSNERDLGVFFYWAPKKIRKRFSMLVNDGYKGSGDYGVFGIGVYNGQTANRPELNGEPHVVVRLTYPFAIKNQFIETSVQAYTGKYVVSTLSADVKTNTDRNYLDQRAALTFVLYPKPFGIQAEYNIGKGPQYNPATDSIEVKSLSGGYVLLNAMLKVKNHLFYPFVRGQMYDGGKKHELDARSYSVRELEIGVEWQPSKYFELTAMYTFSERRFEDHVRPDNFQSGSLLRLQAQLNF